jgi:hypothetical protein
MNSFSINRFGKTLRYVLSTNFRSLLMWTIGAALVVFMCEMLYWKFGTLNESPYEMLRNFGDMGMVLYVVASVVLISSVVAGINNKRKRESFLMLPSTNAEKYLSLIVYSTVICILCVFLAMVLGDTLRMAFLWGRDLMGFTPRYEGEPESVYITNRFGDVMYANSWVRWYDSALPVFWNSFLPNFGFSSWYGIMRWAFFLASLLWIHSLYTLGGTLLRKYAFVAASVVFILLLVGFVKFMEYYNMYTFRSEWIDADGTYNRHQIGILVYVYCILMPILSIANYWLSFRIFKGFELITNKWINYDFHK